MASPPPMCPARSAMISKLFPNFPILFPNFSKLSHHPSNISHDTMIILGSKMTLKRGPKCGPPNLAQNPNHNVNHYSGLFWGSKMTPKIDPQIWRASFVPLPEPRLTGRPLGRQVDHLSDRWTTWATGGPLERQVDHLGDRWTS